MDENGLEELRFGDDRSTMSRRGFPATLGAMGAPDLRDMQRNPARTYAGEAPYGSMDPHGAGRVARRRAHRRRRSSTRRSDCCGRPRSPILRSRRRTRRRTTGGSASSAPTSRASFRRRTCRSPIPPRRPANSSEPSPTARRACYVAPFTHDGKPLGHPDHDAVFAAAQDLDVPFAIHPTFEPQWTKGTRMGTWEHVKELRLLATVQASDGVRHQFTTLFDYGVFDRFPDLRVLVLESGGGWIGYWLDRTRRGLRTHVHRRAGAARPQTERLLP